MHSRSMLFPLAGILALTISPAVAHDHDHGQETHMERERDDYNLYYQNRKNVREQREQDDQEIQQGFDANQTPYGE